MRDVRECGIRLHLESMKKITGSIVAIVTPMHKDCSLDTTSLND